MPLFSTASPPEVLPGYSLFFFVWMDEAGSEPVLPLSILSSPAHRPAEFPLHKILHILSCLHIYTAQWTAASIPHTQMRHALCHKHASFAYSPHSIPVLLRRVVFRTSRRTDPELSQVLSCKCRRQTLRDLPLPHDIQDICVETKVPPGQIYSICSSCSTSLMRSARPL